MGVENIKLPVSSLYFQKTESHSGNKGNFFNLRSFINLLVSIFWCGKRGKCGIYNFVL
jgi:hypothetical protein